MSTQLSKKVAGTRLENVAARRHAIVEAALEEFLAKGFASARVDDIARSAGVGKGTIYLHFADKEALFQAIVQQEVGPHIAAVSALAESGASLQQFVETAFPPILRHMVTTRSGAVLRMFIAEAGRFPQLASSYYRQVMEPGLASIRTMAQRSEERGEPAGDALLRFPQLMFAPLLLSVFWTGLFEPLEHLDVEGLARTYFAHLCGAVKKTGKRKRATE